MFKFINFISLVYYMTIYHYNYFLFEIRVGEIVVTSPGDVFVSCGGPAPQLVQ